MHSILANRRAFLWPRLIDNESQLQGPIEVRMIIILILIDNASQLQPY